MALGLATANGGQGRALVFDYRPCAADADDNGVIDLADLAALVAGYGAPGGLAQGDINGDGLVSLDDLAELLGQYGNTCP